MHAPFETFVNQGIDGNGFKVLAIEPKHAAVLTTLPFHHRVPFDRMLVAQGIAESLAIVSNDSALDAYGIKRWW